MTRKEHTRSFARTREFVIAIRTGNLSRTPATLFFPFYQVSAPVVQLFRHSSGTFLFLEIRFCDALSTLLIHNKPEVLSLALAYSQRFAEIFTLFRLRTCFFKKKQDTGLEHRTTEHKGGKGKLGYRSNLLPFCAAHSTLHLFS